MNKIEDALCKEKIKEYINKIKIPNYPKKIDEKEAICITCERIGYNTAHWELENKKKKIIKDLKNE